MSRQDIRETKVMGRPRTLDAPVSVGLRLPAAQAHALDAWIAAHPKPRPTRSEAIRRLLAEALESQQPASTTDQKIARAKRKIADNPVKGEPSPAKGMAMLRRGLTENRLRTLKSGAAKAGRTAPAKSK